MEMNTSNPATDFDAAMAPFIERARAAIGAGIAVPYAQLEQYWQDQLKDEMTNRGVIIGRGRQLLYKDRNDKNKLTLVRYALGGAGEAPFDVLLADVSSVQPLFDAEAARRQQAAAESAKAEHANMQARARATGALYQARQEQAVLDAPFLKVPPAAAAALNVAASLPPGELRAAMLKLGELAARPACAPANRDPEVMALAAKLAETITQEETKAQAAADAAARRKRESDLSSAPRQTHTQFIR